MPKWILLLTLLAFNAIALARDCRQVWLTVSSLWSTMENSNAIVDSQLEVNWNTNCFNNSYPDVIKVFNADPTKRSDMQPQLTINILKYPDKYYRTNISVNRVSLPGEWDNNSVAAFPVSNCLKHYAALYVNDTIITSTCLKIRPTWMYSLR